MEGKYRLYDSIVSDILGKIINSDHKEVIVDYSKKDICSEFELIMGVYGAAFTDKPLLINCSFVDYLNLRFKKKISFKRTKSHESNVFNFAYETANDYDLDDYSLMCKNIFNEYYRGNK